MFDEEAEHEDQHHHEDQNAVDAAGHDIEQVLHQLAGLLVVDAGTLRWRARHAGPASLVSP
jgi:hypothetical protein